MRTPSARRHAAQLRSMLALALLAGAAGTASADPLDEPPDRDDDLRDEPTRSVSPPGPGGLRLEPQVGGGVLEDVPLGTAGGELRVGIFRPLALTLGGEALLVRSGTTGYFARAGLRLQSGVTAHPWVAVEAVYRGKDEPAAMAGLGIAFPFTPRVGASLGGRLLLPLRQGPPLGALGVLALTYGH